MEENRCLEEQTHRHSRKQYRKMPQCRQIQGQTCRWRLPSQNTAGKGVLALADVKIGDFMTIRNVRIKEDDYGLTVAMPKTKAGANEQYKDTVFFADRGIKERFDQTVQKAYETFMHQQTDLDEEPEEAEELEQEESGMNMGM